MAAPDVDLGKKVGPFPLGVWVALVGGGLGLGLYLRNRNKGSSSADAGDEDAAGPDYTESASGLAGVGLGAAYVPAAAATNDTNVTPKFQTNEEWAQAALQEGLARGYTATVVNSALQKWLYNSGTLSTQEASLINILVGAIGAPPVTPSTTDVTQIPQPGPVTPVTPVNPTKYVRLRLAPTGLFVAQRTKSSIRLRCNKVAGATQYRWYMTGRNGYVTTTTPGVDIKALRSKRTYHFQVVAWNPMGPSPRSASVSGTTL